MDNVLEKNIIQDNNTFEMIAKTFMGLENVLAEELTNLGADDIQIGRRSEEHTSELQSR